jgi:pyridoxal phosphate enzyme (YggS family)
MPTISENLAAVRTRVDKACRAAQRDPADVTVVAVGKTFGPADLKEAYDAGQRDFAENYAQEALPKIQALPREGTTWHFIGDIQSNKTADIAAHFDWVHGLDREKIARRLSEQRPSGLEPLNLCVQVNVSGEKTKSGVLPDTALSLCQMVTHLPRIRLRGLMAIPAPPKPGQDPREPYRRLRELYAGLQKYGFELDTLSAGMSEDFEAAIAEGSTMVRIGTAIFGERKGLGAGG